MDTGDNNMEVQLQSSHGLDVEESQTSECADGYSSSSNVDTKGKDKNLIVSKVPRDMIPEVGMEFESEIAAYNFYNRYAGKMGFSVRRSKGHKERSGKIIDRVFCCSCQGRREKDKRDADVRFHRQETRCGCLAEMKVHSQIGGKYCVIKFVSEHSHPLINPVKSHLLRSQRKTKNSNIAPKASLELTARQSGDRENLRSIIVNCKNYLRFKRTIEMKLGDTGSMLACLQQMQLDDPNFFYAIQVDEDDQITNIFWADSRMIMDYAHFGDVVCFNTTYRKCNEDRPFALFSGVNHHKQTIVFGVTLLYDETVNTYNWLFGSFVEAMSGKKPKTILTDQDAAIAHAVASLWPETHHRLCVWHIYHNANKYLSSVFRHFSNFAEDFSNCLYDHEEEEDDFVNAWNRMLEKYDLKTNVWLRQLFDQKEKWALVYGRQTFCADITSTQRMESMDNHIKKYISYKYDFLKIFHHFQKLVEDRRYEELKAESKVSQSTPVLAFPVEILQHVASVYTPELFKMFQDEFGKTWDCDMHNCGEVGTITEYKVIPYWKQHHHTVTFDSSDGTVICSCKKFEFVGILCAHALKVLGSWNVRKVPTRYILKRWTKDARAGSVKETHESTTRVDPKVELGIRYKKLCQWFNQLATRAAETKEAYKITLGGYSKMLEDVEASFKDRTIEEPAVGASHSFSTMTQLSDPTMHQKLSSSTYNSSVDQHGFTGMTQLIQTPLPPSGYHEFISSSYQ